VTGRRPDPAAPDGSRPLALVYRGPASTPGCPEAVAAALRRSRWDLQVRFVGPGEDLPLEAAVLAGAVLYAQPGGGSLRRAYRRVRSTAPASSGPVAAIWGSAWAVTWPGRRRASGSSPGTSTASSTHQEPDRTPRGTPC
jgi:hypothetical protein